MAILAIDWCTRFKLRASVNAWNVLIRDVAIFLLNYQWKM